MPTLFSIALSFPILLITRKENPKLGIHVLNLCNVFIRKEGYIHGRQRDVGAVLRKAGGSKYEKTEICVCIEFLLEEDTVDSPNTHSNFFLLASLHFGSLKAKSSSFQITFYLEVVMWPSSGQWDISIERLQYFQLGLPLLFLPFHCPEYISHPRVEAALIKDDEAEEQEASFLKGILEPLHMP